MSDGFECGTEVLPLSHHHDFPPNGSRFFRSICMASPSPKRKVEVRFCCCCAAVLLLQTTDPGALLSPAAFPHAMFPPTAIPRPERSRVSP